MTNLFPVIDQLIHLNHAAVGPWPQRTADAVRNFADENASIGSLKYSDWMKVEKDLRRNLAQLINAPSEDEIALVKNTSEGLSLVAYGLSWKKGDNVVGIQQEFPSNRFVWDSLCCRGVDFRKLDLDGCVDPEQALMDSCDDRTRLVSISAVQFQNGFKMDLTRIGEFCRQRDILFCVDAIQQIGALPFDVQAISADFVIADGHKWLLAAEGLALFYVRKEIMDQLSIQQYGWHMVDNMGDYTQQDFSLASTARRFECGSPNMLGIHALNASVELLLETGMHDIGSRVLQNTRFLIEQLTALKGVRILSDTSQQRMSGIVTFAIDNRSGEDVYQQLKKEGVLCAARGGGVRLSPHFYTPREQLSQTIEMVTRML
jgi:selenocysteine lyase/cysteine desulfurase